MFCVLVSASENHSSSIMIVLLLHGCRLEVMCNLVWDHVRCQCACGWQRGIRIQKLFLLVKNIWKVLLSAALNHSPLQQSLATNLRKHPPQQADYTNKWSEGGGLCANSSYQPWICLHTPSHRGHKFLVLLFVCFVLGGTILYRRIYHHIFSAVIFLIQVPLSSLHYTLPLYVNEECPAITIRIQME